MGDLLFLKSPQRAAATPSEPEDYEPPKGRVLLFWGCGETARPGQPVEIDFAKMAAGQVPPACSLGNGCASPGPLLMPAGPITAIGPTMIAPVARVYRPPPA